MTFAGGNGFSFTIAAEDPMSNGRRDVPTFDDYEGQNSPDGVANIRVDQGWGSAQVMAAVHPIHDTNGFGDSGGTQSTSLGFAVGAGLTLGIPGGWEVSGQGGYADGALGYITRDPGIGGARLTFLGITAVFPAFHGGDFVGPNSGNTTKAWNARAGIQGPLINPNLSVYLEGSYTQIRAPGIGAAVAFTSPDGTRTGTTADPFDYDFWAVQAGAAYTLAPGLTTGPEFAWEHEDWKHLPFDNDVFGFMWRTQRNF